MPSYVRGRDNTILRFVQIDEAKPIFYGWKSFDLSSLSSLSSADLTVLNHVTPAQMGLASGAIGIIGANSPKPARVRKTLIRRPTAAQQGSVSTFIGGDALVDWEVLIEAGWELVTPAKRVTISDNDRSQTVGALCSNGGIYCFPLSKTVPEAVYTELGLFKATELRLDSNYKKCFSGTSKPRPPKVQKDGIPNGDGATYDAHTFCSVDVYENALQTGWLPVKGEVPYFSGTAVTLP